MVSVCNYKSAALTRAYRSTKQIDVKTGDNLQYKFYPVKGKCFAFEVQAANDAHIALSPYPYIFEPTITEIIIGGWKNSRSVIRRNRIKTKPEKSENKTINILNKDESRRFCVRWQDDGTVLVDCDNYSNSFLKWKDPEPFSIYYVGICTGWGARGCWKFEVPESYGNWQDARDGYAPQSAVLGGQERNGEQTFVARAMHNGVMTPGKLVTSHGCVYISWGGQEYRKTSYQVLVGGPNYWVATQGSNVPQDAIEAGKSHEEPLYVGRVLNKDHVVTIGKVQKSHGVCYIPFDGKELAFTDYEILML